MSRINNKLELKSIRKKLRSNLTLAEAIIWNHLKQSRLGKKFRRQHSLGNYIVDFYAPEPKLAIELDGSTHNLSERFEKDKAKNKYLEKLNIKVLHIRSLEVMRNLEGVLEEIKKHL